MKLFDTLPHSKEGVDIGSFDGGMFELKRDEITKSFSKAKKVVLARLMEELKDVHARIDYIESLSESDCARVTNPYC